MKIFLAIFLIVSSISSCGIKRPNRINQTVSSSIYNDLSENLLKNLKENKFTSQLVKLELPEFELCSYRNNGKYTEEQYNNGVKNIDDIGSQSNKIIFKLLRIRY